jgi:hypothetical protein
MNENYKNVIFLIEKSNTIFPQSFVIITACNPMDKILEHNENQKLNADLLEKLNFFKREVMSITGSSLDLKHQEPSYLIEVGVKEGVKMGRSFNQRAIYWVNNDHLYLIDCTTEEKESVGSFSEKIKFN